MGDRLGVTFTGSVDSISFDAQGIGTSGSATTFRYAKGSPASVDSFVVNTLGMVVQ